MTGNGEPLELLCSWAEAAQSVRPAPWSLDFVREFGKRGLELSRLLEMKNGFYAFERALHIFSVGNADGLLDLKTWNSKTVWRSAYGDMADGLFFFVADAFGYQWCIEGDEIRLFDPETGERKHFANSIEGWVDLLLGDINYQTGYTTMHQWTSVNGLVELGNRLVPRIPFVCRGSYDLSNLKSIDAVQGMLYRADIARRIRHLPDGATIQFYTY
jgi:hypothetical protein